MAGKLVFYVREKLTYVTLSLVSLALLVLMVLIGSVYALSVISAEAETGTLSGSVSAVNDSGASGGRAIQFVSGQPTTPLPNPGAWTDVTGSLVGVPSDCGSITSVYAIPGSNKVIAGVARNGLWATANDGTWTKMPGSANIINRPSSIVFDPTNPNTFWEAGLYDAPGVNKTTDGGNTFQNIDGGSASDLLSVSVDFSDPTRQRLLAGARRRSQIVWKTTDGGAHWTNIGLNLPDGSALSTNPIFIDANTYLVNTDGWGGGTAGVWRTTNGGSTWQRMTDQNARYAPLVASNGTIYWSSGDSLIKSTNQGQTWTRVGSGLTDNFTPIELPDGRIVTKGSDHLVVSADGGVTWSNFGATIPFLNASGFTNVTYSAVNGAFYASQFTCGPVGDSIKAGAIWRLK